jgi:DNA-binding MurR/RpiR family transcriptional regulator
VSSTPVVARFNSVRLSPAQRLIGDFVVEHLADISLMSTTSIAAGAGVSQSSVSRFCRALGFEDFGEFQQWLHDQALAVSPAPRPADNRYQRVVAAEHEAMAALAEWLADPAELVAAAESLMSSPCLPVIGTRVSAASAMLAAYFARRIHPDVRLITASDSGSFDELTQARLAGATAALAVWLPRYTDEVARFLGRCSSQLALLVITDLSADPPLPKRCRVLPVSVSRTAVFDGHAAVTGMVGALAEAMCRVEPASTASRLAAFED